MKKIVSFSVVFIMLSALYSPCMAQLKGFGIGPFVEAGWPTGNFQDTHKMGLGAGIGADIKLPGKLGLTGSLSYMQFNGKTITTPEGDRVMPDIKAVPIRAGLKYRVLPLLYFKLEGGVANYTGGDGSAFIASPGIGLRILGFDFQGKYEAWLKDGNTYAFWGLKAGINF